VLIARVQVRPVTRRCAGCKDYYTREHGAS